MSNPIAQNVLRYDHSGTKEVEYFGIKLMVADYTKYIAMDIDGAVFGYEDRPSFNRVEWLPPENKAYSDIQFLADLVEPNILPQDSLVSY